MTLNGAIMQLVEMRENSLMPAFFKPYFDKVIETVSECEEPSAQSEVAKDTNVPTNDCISRQGAIDAFKKELTIGESKGNYATICSVVGYEGARQILESLPSAQTELPIKQKCTICPHCDNCDVSDDGTMPQPEIIRCKDCKWFNDIGCAIRIVDDTDKPSENDFCSFAERREE